MKPHLDQHGIVVVLQAPFFSQLVQTPSIPGGWWTGMGAVLALYCIYEQISFAASRSVTVELRLLHEHALDQAPPSEITAACTDAGPVSKLFLVHNMLFRWWGV